MKFDMAVEPSMRIRESKCDSVTWLTERGAC